MEKKKELSFLDAEKNRQAVQKVFYACLVLLLVVDFFIEKHGHFSWETAPVFYAVYGFVACVSLIFVAKILRLIVKRKEGYYD
jgi:hypothetical protein